MARFIIPTKSRYLSRVIYLPCNSVLISSDMALQRRETQEMKLCDATFMYDIFLIAVSAPTDWFDKIAFNN